MEKHKLKHIVCFALPAWEADYLRSTVELMKGLATNNLVLYIDYAYTITDCIKGMMGKKRFDWKRLLGIKKRLRKISGDKDGALYVLSLPPVLPSFLLNSYSVFKVFNKINALVTGFFINRAIRKLRMRNIIGFNSFQPFLGHCWTIKNLSYMVYYIYDDFTDVPWFKGFVEKEEQLFIDKTDLIIVSSEELKRRKQHYNIPVEVVNNGVHFNDFNQQIKHPGVEKTNVKTIGYIGSIDNRIDINLLEPVIKAIPEANFCFIGKVFEQQVYDRLIKYSNVKFMPPVPANQVPVLLSKMHVGIIPYVCNKLTAAIYPLKANEYLAMGLPVVMTPFASIGEADEVVHIADNSILFTRYISEALAENDNSLPHKRASIAKQADWQERSRQLENLVESYMNEGSEVLSLQQT